MDEPTEQVQINVVKEGNAMTLICDPKEWERVRKAGLEKNTQLVVTGTDGEKILLRTDDIFTVVYLSEDTYRRLKEKEQEAKRRAQTRQDIARRSGVVPGPGMRE